MILLLGDWAPEQEYPSIELNLEDAFVLLNLEGPISPQHSNAPPILKSGPHLHTSFLPTLDSAAAVFFALANNHIMDYGWHVVQATMAQLANRQYRWAGVGQNEELARKPLLIVVNGRCYAVFSLCEVQIGRATTAQPGTATIGPWIYEAIHQVRSEVDTVIISVHAANEMLPWPSPLIQDLYRSYIDAGADIVHGHHSHVPQGVESYNGGIICYGLGNFLASPNRYKYYETQISLGVRIRHLSHKNDFEIEVYRFSRIGRRVVVREEKSHAAETYVAAIQAPLTDRHLLEALWQEAALRLYDKYGRDSIALPPTSEKRYLASSKHRLKSLIRRTRRRYGFTRHRVQQNQVVWYNTFACLSHRSMMETALGLLSGELTDIRSCYSNEMASRFLSRLLSTS